MKINHYLKVLKICFLINIILGSAFLILFLLGAKDAYKMFLAYEGTSIVKHIHAISEILLRVPPVLETVIVALIGFFIARNFRLVYGKIKHLFH